MFIPALKQTIFTIRSKLLVYNRQHLFSKSHIYRSPSLRFTEAPTSNPLGKRWRSLSKFPWKTASSGTSNAVAASARYHATSPSSLIKSRGSQHSLCREPRLHFFWPWEQITNLKVLVLLCALRQYAKHRRHALALWPICYRPWIIRLRSMIPAARFASGIVMCFSP